MRLVSPVYGKELIQLAHHRRHAVLKLLFLLVLCLCTAVVLFPLDTEQGVARARLGLAFFATLFYVTLLATAVFTPLLTSGCIAGEREANTLPLLLHTRLTPRNIAQDKGLSRITHMLYLASLTFPFLALTLLLGGVEITHVVAAGAYVLGTVLVVGGLSLFFSALRETTLRALASTYLYGVLLLAVTGALAALVCGLLAARFPLALVNPAVGMAMLLDRDYDGLWIALAAGGYLVGATVGYFLAVGFAAGVIRRRATEAGEAVSAAPAASATRRAPWRSALTRPLHLPPIRAVDIGGRNRFNPLALATRLWQEARRHPFAAAVFLAIVLAPGLTGGGLRAYRAFPLYAGVYALAAPLLLLVTLLQAAACFSHERERQRLELVLATGQRGRDLVRGTYLALLAAVYPYLLGLGLVVILGALISAPNAYFPSRVSAWAIAWLALYLNFLLVLGMRLSLRSRTNLRAISWLFLVVGLLAVGPFVLAGVVYEVFDYGGNSLFAGLNCLSPLTLLTLGIEVASWRELWDKHSVMITLNAMFYAEATAFLYFRMATRFDRLVGRQPGG